MKQIETEVTDRIREATASLRYQDAGLLQIVDAAFADSARRSGEHLVCRPGCTQCCHGAFAIGMLDALRLREGMATLAASDSPKAASVQARAEAYLAEFALSFPGNRTTGFLDAGPEAEEAFEDFANEAACPALDPASGLCDLYDARPMTCRVFGPPIRIDSRQVGAEEGDSEQLGAGQVGAGPAGAGATADDPAFAVCELCFTAATPAEIAAAEMHIPHEEEQRLIDRLGETGNTIVAYCLMPPQS